MAKVELKQPVVAEIAELFDGAASAVVVDYRGLTVEQDTALRKQLREAGVTSQQREPLLKLLSRILKDRQPWLYPRQTQQLRPES